MARITMWPNGPQPSEPAPVSGIWLEGKKGIVGLVADDAVGTYICLYGPGVKNKGSTAGNPLPALVIVVGEDGDAILQIPHGPAGEQSISIRRIIEQLT